jgi:hypothetical protein
MIPAAPAPKSFFVGILDLLGFKSHLWGNNRSQRLNGLANLYEKYTLFLTALNRSINFAGFQWTEEQSIRNVNEQISHLVASDTVVLWSAEDKVDYLIWSISNLVNTALTFNVPLRGTLAYGDCIIDPLKNIFIGYPIVEAIEAEKLQEWIGVGVLPTAASRLKHIDAVVEYTVPLKTKENRSNLPFISHAVAWHWAEFVPNAPHIRIERLMQMAAAKDKIKYKNALLFVKRIIEKNSSSQ